MRSLEFGLERDPDQRAVPPQLPLLTPAQKQRLAAHNSYLKQQEKVERRSVVRGLILLALLVLVASMLRAGMGRVFVPGWWRP